MSKLALDRDTMRTTDVDGRLHVKLTNISKATVDPYYGHEIPDADALGLQPDRIYQMLRHPDELARAASTFNNIQLLLRHVPVSADDPMKEITIGSTGTDCVFDSPYLQNSLVVWDADAIKLIESKEQCELSCAYRYIAEMKSGTFNDLRYDGIMRNIVGNHVALVSKGRAGPDVLVADSLPETMNMAKANLTKAKKIAADAGIDVDDVVKVIAALNGAEPDVAATDDDMGETEVMDGDNCPTCGQAKPMDAEDSVDTDEDEEVKNAVDEEDPEMKPAMDAELIIKDAKAAARKEMAAIRQAERDVFPHVGEIKVAMDSAESIYAFALKSAGVDVKGVHPSAYPAILKMLPRKSDAATPFAQDSAEPSPLAKALASATPLKRS